jgi:hypothetical protein
VGAGPNELENIALDSVNEQPVTLDVTLLTVFEYAFECVVAVFG